MLSAAAVAPKPLRGAETVSIAQALAFAYAGNPALRAERARQRATDEAVPQALSGWRPVITAEANAGIAWVNSNAARATTDSLLAPPSPCPSRSFAAFAL
jgi:outer membrane protein